MLADLQMVLELEEVRSLSSQVTFNTKTENERYERAFRKHGIDVDALDTSKKRPSGFGLPPFAANLR
jgi:hypothetical protein